MKARVDYLRRCSIRLQAGKPVADVAYSIGEDAPKMAVIRKAELQPAGLIGPVTVRTGGGVEVK